MKKKNFTKDSREDYLKTFRKLPAHLKLEWLEEAGEFLFKAMPRKSKITAEKLKTSTFKTS